MLRQNLIFEIKKNERLYQFQFENGCPLGELSDVLFEMRGFVIHKINESLKEEPKKDEGV